MRICVTADLHDHQPWFEWLLDAANRFDLVVVAGDLLDGGSRASIPRQRARVKRWMARFSRTGVPLVLCSGNHDNQDPLMEPHGSAWMAAAVPPGAAIVCDGQSRLLRAGTQPFVATATAFNCNSTEPWTAGSALADSAGAIWIVAAHEPPMNTRVGGPGGDWWTWMAADQFQPDLLLGGHLHEQPFTAGGSPIDRIGRTLCVNAGRLECGHVPCHVAMERTGAGWRWEHVRGLGHKAGSVLRGVSKDTPPPVCPPHSRQR